MGSKLVVPHRGSLGDKYNMLTLPGSSAPRVDESQTVESLQRARAHLYEFLRNAEANTSELSLIQVALNGVKSARDRPQVILDTIEALGIGVRLQVPESSDVPSVANE